MPTNAVVKPDVTIHALVRRLEQVVGMNKGDTTCVVPTELVMAIRARLLWEMTQGGSGCECCDHKLQHAIREFLNTYDNAVPPLRVAVVVDGLRDALATWEGDQ